MQVAVPMTPPSLPTPAVPTVPATPAKATPPVSTVPAPAPRMPTGSGLPAPLVALLRAEGPFLANGVYSVTPTEALVAINESVAAPKWYAITCGRFVSVVDQFAPSTMTISGVAHGVRKAYTTQGLVLDAFNQALTWGGVQVL
ncbi:hypothetical protein B0H17DRAFT_1207901 [Mycena rosella]|uniref:Uncharacterized protein n=1 Tax=Mycena rosella TaxID=1033263 RepID=A0AAD7GBU2_MYCRO|nr:hypothetical protein B0H17DRAFT_1207901 [Mycena rosella]